MKSFAIRLALFGLLAGGVVLFEWSKTEHEIAELRNVDSHFERGYKIRKLLQQVSQPKIVFAGDSRAEKSLIPAVFEANGWPAINIGTAAGDLVGLVYAMKASGLDKVSAVFLISTSIFNVNDGALGEGHLSPEEFIEFTPWERIKVARMGYFYEARRMIAKAREAAIYPAYWDQAVRQPATIANLGYVIDPADGNKPTCEKIRFSSRHSRNPWYRDVRVDGAKWRVFADALKTLSEGPGTYIVYNPPVSPAFKECVKGTYADEAELAFGREATEYVKSLGKRNVRFVDFYSEPPPSFGDDDFFDTHHLNSRGARKFSELWLRNLAR